MNKVYSCIFAIVLSFLPFSSAFASDENEFSKARELDRKIEKMIEKEIKSIEETERFEREILLLKIITLSVPIILAFVVIYTHIPNANEVIKVFLFKGCAHLASLFKSS